MSPRIHARRQPERGFTLVELIITLAVLGVLATLAMPSFRNLVLSQRVKTASFDLTASLAFTRSEAIKRNSDVAMTPASGGWQNGWTITAGGTVLNTQNAFTNLSITDSASVSSIVFSKDGRLGSAATSFTVATNPSSSSISPRCITISLGGRSNSKLGSC